MASRHTEHYGLSQWEASDKVERTDFNADNAAVDGALHALAQSKAETAALSQLSAVEGSMPRTAFGSYTGNGTSGPESPVSLTFSFPPQLLAVRRSGSSADRSGLLLLRGVTQGGGLGHIDFYVNVTWSGNQVSWYTSKDNPSTQMNSEGVEYFYFAIG